jgi:hypothetical protein
MNEFILIPAINNAAETWTFSNKGASLSVQLSHDKSLYSRTGRITNIFVSMIDDLE